MKNNINITGKIIAIISFVIGTCLLSFYLYFGEVFMPLEFALTFIIAAIIINIIIFTVIIGLAILNKTQREEALKTCGLMLLNIPVSILYFYMVITFPTQHFFI